MFTLTNFFIDPTASFYGDGSATRPFSNWSDVSFSSGNSYLQKAGTTVSANLHVTAQANSSSRITIGSYGAGAMPVIQGNINLDGASYTTISGLDVIGGGADIIIQHGANHIDISRNVLSNSFMGLWMGNDAGGDNLIRGNTITGNSNDGIAIDKIANNPGHVTGLIGNIVSNNGVHGIELDGSNFIVANNVANGNGFTTAGASGIHVYGGAPDHPDGFGVGNTIVKNVTQGNHDRWQTDGNGIELDQYTHNNVVALNLSTGNDGAGIAIFDSYHNVIAGNVMGGNEIDPGHTHLSHLDLAFYGQISLTNSNILLGNMTFRT